MFHRSLLILFAALSPSWALAQGPSYWNHNGSKMELIVEGESAKFVYVEPRSGIAAQGVTAGTVLFEGTVKEDHGANFYSGQAWIFSARCGSNSYSTKGSEIWDPLPRLAFKGTAPDWDRQTCQSKGSRKDELAFNYIPPAFPTGSAATCDKLDFDEYKECLERKSNALCRDHQVWPNNQYCFRSAAAHIYEVTGIGGFAKNLAIGDLHPFTHCNNSYCKFAGGGSSYICRRADDQAIEECEGNDCTRVACPIRRCRMICNSADENAVEP